MSEKFESLDELVTEYYGLVKENKDGLPPYATFKTYLVDTSDDCKDCIDRPKKIKDLVDKLNDDEKKLQAILELWASNKKSTVLHENFSQNHPQLIHSITPRANTLATKLELKKITDYAAQKRKIEEFITDIINLVNDYSKDEFQEGFKDLSGAEKELIFWAYYDKDIYPIINRRAIHSKMILEKAFDIDSKSDIDFNHECMEVSDFNSIKKGSGEEIYISKQLMLDQLFYSIDDMKSMKKVDDKYSSVQDKNNDIYKFYQKLWNTIQEAKMNKNLQQYYDDFIKIKYNQKWKNNLRESTCILNKLKMSLQNNEESNQTYEYINKLFQEISKSEKDFLDFYLFETDNGIASIGNGFASNDDIKKIKNILEKDDLLYMILTKHDIHTVHSIFNDDVYKDTSRYNVIRNRFLAVLFSENMTTIANEDNFNTLIKNLKNKLNITLESDNYIDKNDELMSIFFKNDGQEETDIYNKQTFYWWLFERLNDNLDLKKAIVYYGAPGTGKTYKAKNVTKEFIKSWSIKNGSAFNKELIEVVQFHPSFSYEDFIEGIRPSREQTLELRDGVFKKFCKKMGEIEIALWKNEEFRNKFKDNSDFAGIKINEALKVEGIKEILKLDHKVNNDLSLLDVIPPAFFIIDEINRADLSRVFGELMYSLEYRGYEGKIKTQYSYLVEKEDDAAVYFYEDGENYFFIPQNVYIIGTMNTIDRSVDSFDFALRRRFSWEEIAPDYNVIRELLDNNIAENIAKAFEGLNKKIIAEPLLGCDYQVGHSYALNLGNQGIKNSKDAKNFLWDNFIYPLLQEYFRGLGDSKSKIDELKKEFFN